MALQLGVISQKGGVGKSTLVRALAVEYARNGFSVLVADMDIRQKTVTDWNCLRMERDLTPAIAVQPFSKVNAAIKHAISYDVLIFDGAGGADGQTLAIAKASDFVILPSGVGRDDLLPQVRLAHELRKNGVGSSQVGFTLSRVGRSASERLAAAEYVEEAGYWIAGYIPEKTSISKAHDLGYAANETRYDTITEVVDNLIQRLNDHMNEEEKETAHG